MKLKKLISLLVSSVMLASMVTVNVFAADPEVLFPVLDVTPTYADVVVGTVQTDAGEDMEIKMNIYKPEGVTEPTPVVIYVHGGRWEAGDYTCEKLLKGWAENGTFLACMSLLEHGVTVVTAGYRLSQEAIFPAQVHDLKGAVRFLRANADTYGIDPDNIIAWGESAGGHLVNLMGTTNGISYLEGITGGNLQYSSELTAVVDYFGMTDILQLAPDQYERPYIISPDEMYAQVDAPSSTRSKLFGFQGEGEGIGTLRSHLSTQGNPYVNPDSPYQAQLELMYYATPMNFVSKDTCPFFICQGGLDFRVAMAQSERFFEALTKVGVEAYMFTNSLASHGNLGKFVDDAAVRFVLNQFEIE